MRTGQPIIPITLGLAFWWCSPALGLNPSLDIGQYGHDAWTVRSGFIKGNIYTIAQTPDGYLWLGSEFGVFRFDGVRSSPWQPPAGKLLPQKNASCMLVTRDGTLWIGTFGGLATWNGAKLTRYPGLDGYSAIALAEDREGTVWAGFWSDVVHRHRLCAIRNGATQCYGDDGLFGDVVFSLYEDGAGNLWAGAESGLWRWKPGPPRRYATPPPRSAP